MVGMRGAVGVSGKGRCEGPIGWGVRVEGCGWYHQLAEFS